MPEYESENEQDAIIVPGGGITSAGEPNPFVIPRLDLALSLRRGETYIILASRGTVHKAPARDKDDFPIDEAIADARYLIRAGCPPRYLLTERLSLDTIGNAAFCRWLHTDPLGLRRLHIVNSDFHLARTVAIFQWVFSLPSLNEERTENAPYQLSFQGVGDTGLEGRALEIRRQKEKAALARLEQTRRKIKNLRELHTWLYHEHQAYKPIPDNRDSPPDDDSENEVEQLQKSY